MLENTLLYVKFGENDIVKDKIEEDKTALECLIPPYSKDQSFNFAINNELKECNEYRLEHLNEEEKENLKRVLFEYNDIQYKEGENLTFTSTIGYAATAEESGRVLCELREKCKKVDKLNANKTQKLNWLISNKRRDAKTQRNLGFNTKSV